MYADEPIVAYALPLLHGEDPRGQPMRVFFTDDEDFARDPVYLNKKKNRLWFIVKGPDGEYAQRMRNVVEWTFPDWQVPVSKVPPGLAKDVNFFAADVMVSPRILRAGYEWRDINAGILEIEFDGQEVTVLDTPPADKIARRRLKRMMQRDCRRVDAELVQANSELWQPREHGNACLVLITFARSAPRDLLVKLVNLMNDLKGTEPRDPDLRVLADIVTDETYYYHERYRLPESVTDGFEVFAAGLWLHRPYLRTGRLPLFAGRGDPKRSLPCLAEPGERGGIELIPYDEVDDDFR